MWLGGKTGVDDDLMDDWLIAVIKASRRGIVGKKLETTLTELVDHLSNGNLAVVRHAPPATDKPGLYAEGGYVSSKSLPLIGEHVSSYPAPRLRDLPEILPGPSDRSDRTGKRDRQRLQSAFKKGVKEGRRIEREVAKKGDTR